MPVEGASYISQLTPTSPTDESLKSEGDNEFRQLKTVLQTQFPNLATTPVTVTSNQLNDVTNKALRAGDTYTGTHNFTGAILNVPTASASDNDTSVASTAMVQAAILASSGITAVLPSQTGNSGKFLQTNGSTATWFATANLQVFTSSGTFTPVAGAVGYYVECLGGGGSGGSGRRGGSGGGGTGGGGGALSGMHLPASRVVGAQTVTVAGTVAGGLAITVDTTNGASGAVGGNSSFGSLVIAYGGSGGVGGQDAVNLAGGGGGGTASAGVGSTGGLPGVSSVTSSAGAGALAQAGASGGRGEYGGGAGAGADVSGIPQLAGGSLFGGAGGGAGGGVGSVTGTAGGLTGSYTTGGGAAGGAAGVAGTAGSATYPFSGGGGGGANASGAGGIGGAGGVGCGGGGGGRSANGFNSGAGGAGGRGEVRVYWW